MRLYGSDGMRVVVDFIIVLEFSLFFLMLMDSSNIDNNNKTRQGDNGFLFLVEFVLCFVFVVDTFELSPPSKKTHNQLTVVQQYDDCNS